MLSTLLLSVTLLAAPQEAEGAQAEAAADPKAVAMIEDFGEQLYDPVEEGLESLSFDMLFPAQMGMPPMGVVHVRWTKGEEPVAEFEANEQFAEMMESMGSSADMMAEPMRELGEEIAAIQTGRLAERILSESTPRMKGAEGALIRIDAPPRDSGALQNAALWFDADGLLQRREETVEMMGQTITQSSTLQWEPAPGERQGLVLAGIESEQPGPMGGTMTQKQSFVREQVGGFPLVTGIEMSAMGQTQRVELGQFVVNGQPARAGGPPQSGEGEGEG